MLEEEIINKLNKLWNKVNDLETRGHKHPMINLGTPTELTIASGVITRTRSNHTVDTEGNASSDNLDTVAGGVEGDLLILRAANGARTVVVKDGTGNIQMAGDFTMDDTEDVLLLFYDGTNWLPA